MTYRVMRAKTGEIVGEFNGPNQFEYAMKLADDLAEQEDHRVLFIVQQTVTVYETPTDNGERR